MIMKRGMTPSRASPLPQGNAVECGSGLNRWGVFFRITLPLLWPSLLAGALLIALHMLVEFGALSIIGLQTFTTAIYQQFELEFSNANAAMLSAVLLAL